MHSMTLLMMSGRICSTSSAVNPSLWMIFICFTMVLLPLQCPLATAAPTAGCTKNAPFSGAEKQQLHLGLEALLVFLELCIERCA